MSSSQLVFKVNKTPEQIVSIILTILDYQESMVKLLEGQTGEQQTELTYSAATLRSILDNILDQVNGTKPT